MRCEDLTRELASPTGKLSPSEMIEHLADCPSCAEWSRRAAHLDQIWEATRPHEPSEATLGALWASASVALDARMVPSTLRLEGLTARRRTWLKTAFIAAQAAAILGAAVFLFRQGGDEAAKVAVVTPEIVTPEPLKIEPAKVALVTPLDIIVETGETAVVTIGSKAEKPQIKFQKELTSDSWALPEYTQHDVSNGVEAMLPNDWGRMAVR